VNFCTVTLIIVFLRESLSRYLSHSSIDIRFERSDLTTSL